MEDIILLDAIERYVNGDLHPDELVHFENLRKSNPEVDQLVVNHIFFLKQLNQIGERKHLKTNLDSLHTELLATQEIKLTEPNNDAKVVSIFGKYKKRLAVAATVAALFTLGAMGIIFAFKKTQSNIDIEVLNKKINEVNNKVNDVNSKVDKVTQQNNIKESRIVASTSGTSFIVNEGGYLITNYHVIEGNKNVYVYNEKFGDLTADVILQDKENDLAVLKITDTSFKPFKKIPYTLKNSDTELGQKIYTLGYTRPPSLTYNEGFISSKSANASLQNKQNFLLTLQVDGGNSGSPILNNNGEIIGIISAKERLDNGFAIGIKPSSVNNIMEVLNNDLKVKSKIFNTSSIGGLSRNEQIKRVENYIFMVKVK